MERVERLKSEKISKLLISFSIPAIIGMLINALYNVVDRIFVGGMEWEKEALSALTLCFPHYDSRNGIRTSCRYRFNDPYFNKNGREKRGRG